VAGRQWILVLATGCADLAGIGDPAPLSADAPEVPCAFGGIDLCLFARPQTSLDIDTDLAIDTSRDCNLVVYEPPSPSVCVIYANEIRVSGKVTASGSRALVLAASRAIEVTGSVDVSAYKDLGNTTPASDGPECVFPTGGSYGGAAGGSFAGKGGNGGSGIGGNQSSNMPTTAAPAVTLPSYVRGGCSDSAFGGRAGGGVWLAAADTIRISSTGRVLANGAGGDGSQVLSFGRSPGGGSGGMIRIAAPHIINLGVIAANGGGGSEGADFTAGTEGVDGADGAIGIARANGGAGGTANGGDGGAGGAGGSVDGLDGNSASGGGNATGGGGGGGAGFIQLTSPMLENTGTVSPTPTS
jgi:hypothetical protein